MSVIRKRKERKDNKTYMYHEFSVRYSVFKASEYARQEAILEQVGKANLTEFIMSKIVQDSLIEEVKTALREMLDSGQLVLNQNHEDHEGKLSGNSAIMGFLRR